MANEPQKIILVIDDLADFREIFSVKLTAAGYRVETASDGAEGLKKVKELRPNLVLLDIKMPGMGGEEVLSGIRRDLATSFTKVVFTTNLGQEGDGALDEALAKKFGADGYIQKSDDLDDLVTRVAGYLKE